ncbi:MAG: DUF885 domain-containing protein [Rhodospirillales bacterium]|nr:DUF885 domain-containing protein [Rhodospirillales bacterium]
MQRSRLAILLLAASLVACTSPQPPASPAASTPAVAAPKLAEVEAEITRTYYTQLPEWASYYGASEDMAGAGFGAKLTARSPASEAARRAAFRALLAKLDTVDLAAASPRDRTVHALLKTQVQSALAPANVVDYGAMLSDWGMWFVPYPVTQLSGPQDAVPKLLEGQHAIRNATDAENYLARLSAYGAAVDQAIETLEHDRGLGVVPPDFVIDKALATIAGRSAGDPAAHPLATGLAAKAREAGLEAPEQWAARAATLVKDSVLPANQRLAAKLQALRAEATHDAGIWRLPQGEALYQAMILHMTDTTRTPQEIHDIGLAEVARITGEMDAILKREGYVEGGVGERMAILAREPRFAYANDAEGKAKLLAFINAEVDKVNQLLPKWFAKLPPQPVVVRQIPPQAEGSSSGGYYDPPALDGSRPGTYWINLRDTAIWPSFKLKTLSYHEANPGHHLQNALGMSPEAPVLASLMFSNAFGEGWALYAEALAHEMGMYADDPWGDLGRLQDELHRAVRLVVDTGMHAKRWSREQAIEYMVATEGGHPKEAEAEVERYAVWPGQALGYKIGMLEIQRLRGVAEKALGERFDVGAFHNVVLEDGGIPLQVLEAKVQAWIAGQQAP